MSLLAFFFLIYGKLQNIIKNMCQHLHHGEELVQKNKESLQSKQRNQQCQGHVLLINERAYCPAFLHAKYQPDKTHVM